MSPPPDDFFELGTVVRPHGVRGQVVAVLDTDNPRDYATLKRVFVQLAPVAGAKPTPMREVKVSKVQFTSDPKRVLLTLAGVESMDAADTLRDALLLLPLVELPPLTGAGQFYYHEVTGFTVVDAVAGPLGPVETFYELPQHDVLAVRHGTHEVLIPVNDAIIKRVDREARELHVTLPEGLLAIYTEEVKPKRTRRPQQ